MNKYGLYYNYQTIKDTLMIIFKPLVLPTKVVENDNVISLYREEELVGINIFNVSEYIKIHANGLIPLINEEILKVINSVLVSHGLEALEYQAESGFKVGEIIDIEEHPESDHLHICMVSINEKEPLQIVCGAANARVGLKCVVATIGTFMRTGEQILFSKLLGIESYGMLCSGKELGIEGYENKKGLLELDETYQIGKDFY
ncbi:MAG TPA: DUF4479 domain-containing protein [Candidatus Onthovivens sp.]|nr:DUF4479 domain-containing protein [Candidatus Onthovivens sp.]